MDLSLENREGLPDALRVLLEANPREAWEAHPEFGPLTRFWLERHLGFRRLLAALRNDARGALDGGTVDRTRLSRLGGAFLNGLHEHHGVEDHVYFPKIAILAPELERGFVLLDADHHRLDEELAAFAEGANAVLRGEDALGRFEEGLGRMDRFLDRHLTDEEELVVPAILRAGERALG